MPRWLGLLREIGVTLWVYVRGQILISLVMSALYAVGFALLGVPFWPLVALFSGFLNLIPAVGGVVSMLIAPLLTWIFRGELWRVLGVLGVCVAVQAIEGFYLTPKIHGLRLSLSPLAVFAVLLIGGALFGFAGLLFAVPALAVAAVIWKYFKRREPPERVSPPAPR
jgi:predicted PurR-regulated permease PerM